MVIRTYFNKNNTIKNQTVNTGLNPVSEIYYGGYNGVEQYSRFYSILMNLDLWVYILAHILTYLNLRIHLD
jgi:hypothetical protein